ncbi:MAG TPA: alkaline phosphatase [Candidatus Methylacidiphilales bacterium]|jgi:alkaline phosphatase|nr:alkaline phosphatase [Candidatus Methylacidiphilales bacterium]
MKWRVALAALFVLLLFAGFAYLYVNTFVRKQQQHAIILFVVNGLDLNTLNLARQQPGRAPALADPDDPAIGDARRRAAYRSERLGIDSFWNVALLNLQDPGQPVPDAGANATAIACGRRVQNGYVATTSGNEALPSLIYEAQRAQRATGLVTTSSLVQPTPVAFYSSIKGKPDPYRNAWELVYSKIDVVLGGGEQYFTPANATNEFGRTDGQDLLQAAADQGYTVIRTRDELNNFQTWLTPKLLGLFAEDQFYFSSLQPENRRQPTLAEMTRVAVSGLNKNINGYFLVVEHDLVARAAEQNFGRLALNEVAEVDEAIQSAVEYAGPDALVMVTNNYSLGAVGPLPEPAAGELVAPVPTVDAAGKPVPPPAIPLAPPPQPRWLTGPGGPAVAKAQAVWLQRRGERGWFNWSYGSLLQPEPAFRFQTRAVPTAEPAWLASRGEGSAQLRGFLNNTDVFDIVCEQF